METDDKRPTLKDIMDSEEDIRVTKSESTNRKGSNVSQTPPSQSPKVINVKSILQPEGTLL